MSKEGIGGVALRIVGFLCAFGGIGGLFAPNPGGLSRGSGIVVLIIGLVILSFTLPDKRSDEERRKETLKIYLPGSP